MARIPKIDRHRVAAALLELSRFSDLSEKGKFKAIAFRNAARTIEALEADLAEVIATGRLETLPGIGKSTAAMITELALTGTLTSLEELRRQYPSEVFELLKIPGLSLRRIGELHEGLGIASVDDLEEACRANRLLKLPGFGAKMQEKIIEGIDFLRGHSGLFLLPVALGAAETIADALRTIPGIEKVEIAGSVRRRMEVVHNINLCVASPRPGPALRAIAGLIEGFEISGSGVATGSLQNGIFVQIHAVEPSSFGALFAVQTGSPIFVEALRSAALAKGLKLTDKTLTSRGKALPVATEEALFKLLGVRLVPAELREGPIPTGRGRAASLVESTDLRGTFHAHTTWSDGKATMKEMLVTAREHGWQYIGMSDHSKTASYAGGLSETDVRRQQGEIARHERSVAPMHVFRGTEADILADGWIDYDDTILDQFDFVIASVHSRFKMSQEEMTQRIVTAISNPLVTFLGHLTGRRLLSRDGYSVDFDRIFDVAADRGVIIEINGHPNRLDLDWRHIRNAVDRGVLFSIHPDAHSTADLGFVVNGTWVARKGQLSPKQIFNTRSLEEVTEYLAARRKAAKTTKTGK